MMNDEFPLNVDRIEDARANASIGRKVVLFKSTASTNDIAWEYAGNLSGQGLCVLAESQHKGRGRRGRTWHSSPGQSILISILLLNQPTPAESLTLTAAVAATEAIQTFCGLGCRIKWPNDILVGGKKLAGILVEKRTVHGQHHFVVGIGINCSQRAEFFQQHDLNMPATSLAIETGGPVDRTELVCILLETFEAWLQKSGESHTIIARWQQQSDLLGRHVIIESDNRQYSGFCRGIDPAEGLIVHLDTGAVRMFSASQTSIIKVEGS
jgi:BirA family biotin operon repressor/biotin-[acetyl-CoA-carboxylase] ligase